MRDRLGTSWLPAFCLVVGVQHASGASFVPIGATHAADVSADGAVIVGFSERKDHAGYAAEGEAFRWTRDGGTIGLGYLADSTSSFAGGVSADGSVVVGFSGQFVANEPPGKKRGRG